MNFVLRRTDYASDGIFGQIEDESGTVLYVTLEHAYECAPKIPAGTFTCKRRRSPKFGYDVFELIDVPGHDFIEIHRGNTEADSDGCVLLGIRRDGSSILGSKLAFNAFMALQKGIDQFILVVC